MIGRKALLLSGLAAAATVSALGVFLLYRSAPPSPPTASTQPVEARSLQLYCQFYVFVESRPRLALLFDVERRHGAPVFRQVYLAEDNGERADYDGKDAPRPEWRYEATADPKIIASTIKVPDTSQSGFHDQDITIELHGYSEQRNAKTFFEASLKSFHFQNLPGKCRQAVG